MDHITITKHEADLIKRAIQASKSISLPKEVREFGEIFAAYIDLSLRSGDAEEMIDLILTDETKEFLIACFKAYGPGLRTFGFVSSQSFDRMNQDAEIVSALQSRLSHQEIRS